VSVKNLYEEASARLLGLRNAVSRVLRALPVPVEQPRDVYRTLGIDRMLGWKLFKVYELEDIFLAAQYIPRKTAFGTFLDAATVCGVDDDTVSEAREAFDQFASLVDVHAGDRSNLELMLMAFSQDGLKQAYAEQQKAAFQANRFIYGLEARVMLYTLFLSPSPDPKYLDVTHVKGFIDLRRNRPNVQWLYEHPLTLKRSGRIESPDVDIPLVDESELPGDGAIPWYPEFCSCEFPDVEKHADNVDYLQEIFPDSSGNTALMTLVFGNHYLTENRFDHADREGTSIKIGTPVELLVIDMFIDTNLFEFDPDLEVRVFTDTHLRGGPIIPGFERSDRERLPTGADVKFMGTGIQASYLHEVRRYEEMLRDAFGRRDLDDSRYGLYRVKLEYPVVPSTVAVVWELDENQ
jgi:hypothetical protein